MQTTRLVLALARYRRSLALLAVATVLSVGFGDLAWAQGRGTRRPSGDAGGGRGARGGDGSRARGGDTQPGGGGAGRAVPRDSGRESSRPADDGRTASDAGRRDNQPDAASPAGGRSRDGDTVSGQAARRRPGSRGGPVVVPDGGYYGGGFYPWGWGGLGFGGAWGGGYWDPWWPGDMPPYAYGGYVDDGSIRLKVKPREAGVYIDGYYAGRVDDYDGVFQRLHVEAGPHLVEIRLDGYETLTFDVRVLPNRTLTYEGELRALP